MTSTMTPSADSPVEPEYGIDRLLATADLVASVLATDGVVAGPAAEQGGLEDLMVAESPTGAWAEAADGTVVLVLMAPEGASRWPDLSTIAAAIAGAATTLGLPLGDLQPIAGLGDLPTDLEPGETVALTGAGLFAGENPIAAVGVCGSLVPVATHAAEADVASAGGAPTSAGSPSGAGSASGSTASDAAARNLHLLSDVVLGVSAELGRTTMTMGELLDLQPGGVIELDREAGAPVDIAVNQTLIARGEVVMVDGRYAVRITEVVADGGLR